MPAVWNAHPENEPGWHPPSPTHMTFKLKTLYCNGILLTPEELANAPRFVGTLIVHDCQQGGACARHLRKARLVEMTSQRILRDVAPPLFEPRLVQALHDQIVLYGYQLHVDMHAGRLDQHVQIWTLDPITDE